MRKKIGSVKTIAEEYLLRQERLVFVSCFLIHVNMYATVGLRLRKKRN